MLIFEFALLQFQALLSGEEVRAFPLQSMMLNGELMPNAIFQPYMVIYGGQFPQLEGQNVPGSEPATFR